MWIYQKDFHLDVEERIFSKDVSKDFKIQKKILTKMCKFDTSFCTFLTSDVLPMRRGEIKTTLSPLSKFIFRRRVSLILSVKLSPDTDTP